MATSKVTPGFVEVNYTNWNDFFTPAEGITVVNCNIRQLDNNIFDIRLNVDLPRPLASYENTSLGFIDNSYFGKTFSGLIPTIISAAASGTNRASLISVTTSGEIVLYNLSEIAIEKNRNTNGIVFSI